MNPQYYRAVDPSSDLAAVERAAGTGRRVRASESKRSESKTRRRRLRPKQLAVGVLVAVVVLAVVAIASASVLRNDDPPSSTASGTDPEVGGTSSPTSESPSEPGSSSQGDEPGSTSLLGTWEGGDGLIRFEQDGDQWTGTPINPTGSCANELAGQMELVGTRTSSSTYEFQAPVVQTDICEIVDSGEMTIVVDGDTAEVTTDWAQGAKLSITRVK